MSQRRRVANRHIGTMAALCLCALPAVIRAQPTAEAQVKEAVERFLTAAGDQDIDAMAAMFAPGASIASAVIREGRWVTSSLSVERWLATQRGRPASARYQEPVNHYTIHIDDGQLAFVRADATLIRDGQPRAHNIDYFTLIRNQQGDWKIVNGSYTSKPTTP